MRPRALLARARGGPPIIVPPITVPPFAWHERMWNTPRDEVVLPELFNSGVPITASQVSDAINNNASNGKTILVEPGTLLNQYYTGRVKTLGTVIQSADPANPLVYYGQNAVNSGEALRIYGASSGLYFRDVRFECVDFPDAGVTSNPVVQLYDCSNIGFYDCKFRGTRGDDNMCRGRLLGARTQGCDYLSVIGCTFTEASYGIYAWNHVGMNFMFNDISDFMDDAIHFIGCPNSVIGYNFCGDPLVYNPAAHADMIQGYTVGADGHSQYVDIIGNFGTANPDLERILYENDGYYSVGRYGNGIYLNNNNGAQKFKDVNIIDNQIWGAPTNAYRVVGGGNTGLYFEDNYAYSIDRTLAGAETAIIPKFDVTDATTPPTGEWAGDNLAVNRSIAAGMTNVPSWSQPRNDMSRELGNITPALAIWQARRALYRALL